MRHRSFRLVHLLILVTLISQSILLPAPTQAHPDNAAQSYPAAASPPADLDMPVSGQGTAGSMHDLTGIHANPAGFPDLAVHAPQMNQIQSADRMPFPQSRCRRRAGDPLAMLPSFVTQSLAGNAGNPPAPDARPSMAQAAARDDRPTSSTPVESQTPDPTATPAPHATPVPAALPRTTTHTAPAATTQLYLPLVTTGGTAAPTPAEPTSVVTLTVSPDQGGTLTSRDGRVSLDVPAGAVTRTTTIRFAPLPDQVVPGYQVVGPFFSFTSRDDQGRPVTQFRRDLTMTVRSTDAPDLRETGLALHYFDEAGSAWQRIASTVEAGSNLVTAQVDHFTTFTLMISRSIVGTSVPLCAGTEIWASPGDIWNNTGTPFVVPENEYHVILTNPDGNSPTIIPRVGSGSILTAKRILVHQVMEPAGSTRSRPRPPAWQTILTVRSWISWPGCA